MYAKEFAFNFLFISRGHFLELTHSEACAESNSVPV